MQKPLSTLETLAPEILQRIAYHLLTDTFLGPLNDLIPLLLTSHMLFDALSFTYHSTLYADIFRFKFDHAAPKRRFSERWTTTKCLAGELKKRLMALKRIRHRHIGLDHVEDLWTAFLMMLESDGRNECQLIEGAGIRQYLYSCFTLRTRVPPGAPLGWFSDTEGTALLIWLLHMTVDRHGLQQELLTQRDIREYLHPFIVSGYRYPSIHGPDSHFEYPLCARIDSPAPHTSGPSPISRTITHYSYPLTIGAPCLTSGTILVSVARTEARLDALPLPGTTAHLPPNRAAAIAMGRQGPTVEDVRYFHYQTRMRPVERCPIRDFEEEEEDKEDDDEEEKEEGRGRADGSLRYERDWYRLVSCHDLWMEETPLRGMVYKLGSVSGCWGGRELIPDLSAYLRMLFNPAVHPGTVSVSHVPLYIRFREHHCLCPDEMLSTGSDGTGWGDGILNAWMPYGTLVRYAEEALEVHDPLTGETIRYETYFPERKEHYSKSACEKLRMYEEEEEEEMSDERSDSGSGSESVQSESAEECEEMDLLTSIEEYEDETEHVSSGVTDILVTGESIERHADAWGHFNYIGRIRPWDGLIVLLRTTTDPAMGNSRWIFRGYIHNDNMVGRWRDTAYNTALEGYQGGFVLYRTDER